MDVVDKGKYNFLVMDDETPNAHAISGHTIIVNKGLLYIFDDRELACIIAHEIAHVSLAHNAQRASVYNSRDRVFIELERMSPDPGLLSAIIKPLAIKAYSKEQETEADTEAVRAIKILGISHEVYVSVLRKLGEHSEKNNEGKGGGLLDNHPSIDSRIEKIQRMNFTKD
jgi:predicted Zn-dependent protease